ncbi:hypothetical protein Lfu02_44010 [Longispora fulva]|uniref:Uncharacterized protein n=1 Tax=Longispora fulva TaxID=619741 RepID=A0A8J7GRH9_9ACTN|nr:hypothetical protein [Longispora fulva]MBG6136858.1 hypothetical protein [Longispora fulva]GIG60029.1 hypothetical protein Lfu02_44010 [Longispora fulva]
MGSQEAAVAVLVPIVTAAVGGAGIVFQDWWNQRSRAGRRSAAFTDAARQVEFAVAWWKARELLGPVPDGDAEARERTLSRLRAAAELVDRTEHPVAGSRGPGTIRRLLLLYGFTRWSARLLRLAYYAALVLLFLITTVVLDEPGSAELTWDFYWAFLVAVLALGLRFWAATLNPPTE